MDKKDKAHSVGDFLGRLLAGVLTCCLTGIVVAMTVRVIRWLMF